MKPSDSIVVDVLKHLDPIMHDKIYSICKAEPFTHSDIERVWNICELESERTHLFIAICLVMYSPQTIRVPVRTTHGLAKAIASVKGCGVPNVSNMIPTIVFQYNNYKAFKEKVDGLINENKIGTPILENNK